MSWFSRAGISEPKADPVGVLAHDRAAAEDWVGHHIGTHLLNKDYIAAPEALDWVILWTKEAFRAGARQAREASK